MAKLPSYAERNINYISSDPFRANYDVQTSLMEHTIKKLAGDLYKPDTMGGMVFYAGIICEIIPDVPGDKEDFSWFASMFGGSETRKLYQYRVFIPELFRGLIAPTIFSSDTSIKDLTQEDKKLYAQSKQIIKSLPKISDFSIGDNKTIAIGDSVWVMFQNSNTKENGFLFSKILADNGMQAGFTVDAVTKGSGVKSSPYSQPAEITPQQASSKAEQLKEPPGFNGKWLVDYSAIIDIMGSSKGWPYRYGWFPTIYDPGQDGESARQEAQRKITSRNGEEAWNKANIKALSKADYAIVVKERPNVNPSVGPYSDWEYGLIGVDCIGFVRRALIRTGIIDPGMTCPDETLVTTYKSKTIGGIMSNMSAKDFANLGDPIKVGDQLPGDYCLHGYDSGDWRHATFVITYPDPNHKNESLMWGSNNGSSLDDADSESAGVGVNGYSDEDPLNTLKLFSPIYGDSYASGKGFHQYYRVKKQFVSKSFLQIRNYEIATENSKIDSNPLLSSPLINDSSLAKNISSDMSNYSAWPFSKENTNLKMFIKYHPRQYAYPSKIGEHPPSVINAPDLFYSKRKEIIEKAKKGK